MKTNITLTIKGKKQTFTPQELQELLQELETLKQQLQNLFPDTGKEYIPYPVYWYPPVVVQPDPVVPKPWDGTWVSIPSI